MTRAIPQAAVDFVSQHEGCKLAAYLDSVGVPTVGFGHTGADVRLGDKITRSQALDALRQDLGRAALRLSQRVKAEVISELSEQQYAALLSFVFNLGAGNWTIWKRLNAREYDRIPPELMKFVNAGGRRLQGLVNRRADECKLWSQGDPETHDADESSSVTRQVGMTPPTPMEKPASTSKTFWAGGTVAAAGVVQGAQQLQALAAPQAANSDLIAKLAGLAAVLIVAGGVAIMVFKWLEARSHRQ